MDMDTENIDITENDGLSAGESKTFDPVGDTRSARKSVLPSKMGNLMLVVMVLVSCAAVYLLRLHTGPQTASAQQQQDEIRVDTVLSMIDTNMCSTKSGAETSAVIDTFYYEANQRQIPLWKLSGNPFVFKAPKRKETPKKATDNTQRNNALLQKNANAEEMRTIALNRLDKLELQSVMVSPNGSVAMISNNLIAQGQKIEGWTVAEVKSRQVILTWKNLKHTLQMPE